MSNRRPLADRLAEKIDRSGGPDACWPFVGAHSRQGYGMVWNKPNKEQLAHRLIWILTNGPIPDGLFVCHRCDNPPCCNPAHLWLGTHEDNMQDREAKKRNTAPPHTRKLNWDRVMAIRSHYAEGRITMRQLAQMHGVAPDTIRRVIRQRMWRAV